MMSDLNRRFGALHSASRREPAPDVAQRRTLLKRAREMVLDARQAIAAAISRDFGGRATAETELLEIVPLMNAIRHASRHLGSWMRDEPRRVAFAFQPARAWVRHEPLGVIGIISPWNYPLLLSLGPLIDALAAGNRAMLKPSELSPAFSDLLARLVGEYFLPEQVTVVTGDIDTARAFAALPFDHLLFTGSTHVGREIMRAAAANLTPVTLELGGKSPAIVAADFPLARAARSIAFGKFVNAGQTCVAPDYVLAPADRAEPLAEAMLAAAQRAYPTIQDNDQYSNILSDRHRARLHQAIEQARAGGATLLSHPDRSGANGKIGPTFVLDPPLDGLLMTEEIFGPVLPILRYRSIEEAIAFVNARERPLALYCYVRDSTVRDGILAATSSGGVTVNGTLMHVVQDDLPFGGLGPSGMGAYHGREGFRRFSHARAVHQIGFVNLFERMGPPWGRLADLAARILTRR
jgi:coniferyl-aldehyde dehydrogenase